MIEWARAENPEDIRCGKQIIALHRAMSIQHNNDAVEESEIRHSRSY